MQNSDTGEKPPSPVTTENGKIDHHPPPPLSPPSSSSSQQRPVSPTSSTLYEKPRSPQPRPVSPTFQTSHRSAWEQRTTTSTKAETSLTRLYEIERRILELDQMAPVLPSRGGSSRGQSPPSSLRGHLSPPLPSTGFLSPPLRVTSPLRSPSPSSAYRSLSSEEAAARVTSVESRLDRIQLAMHASAAKPSFIRAADEFADAYKDFFSLLAIKSAPGKVNLSGPEMERSWKVMEDAFIKLKATRLMTQHGYVVPEYSNTDYVRSIAPHSSLSSAYQRAISPSRLHTGMTAYDSAVGSNLLQM